MKFLGYIDKNFVITCTLLLMKNLLRNSTPDIFIIKGGLTQGKSQALYDIYLPGMNVLRYVTNTQCM